MCTISKRENKENKKRFSISEYDVDVEFARDIIQVLDCTTDRLLEEKHIDMKEKIYPETVERRSYSSFRAESDSGKNYLVNLDFVRQHDVLKTGGEYILDICLISPYHGFYFGLYEIGEFIIDQRQLTLKRIKSHPIKFVGSGVAILMKQRKGERVHLYFGLRETEGDSVQGPHQYYVAKMDWNSKPGEKSTIVWKKSVPAAVMSLVFVNNLLFVGLKNGELQILDLRSEWGDNAAISGKGDESQDHEIIIYKGVKYRVVEKKREDCDKKEVKIEKILEELTAPSGSHMIFNQKLFEGDNEEGIIIKIEYLPHSSKIAVVGGVKQQKGSIAIFSTEGELILNTELGNSIIKGITQTSTGLFVTNAEGILYHFQMDFTRGVSTKNIMKVQLDNEIMSNLIVVRDWVCGSGAETLLFVFAKDVRKRSTNHLDDTLARCLVAHEFGVISGDDLGDIWFWKIGDLQIHEE